MNQKKCRAKKLQKKVGEIAKENLFVFLCDFVPWWPKKNSRFWETLVVDIMYNPVYNRILIIK
jgi:hypothetical protein